MTLKIAVREENGWKAAFPAYKKTLTAAAKAAFKAGVTDAFPAKDAEISFLLTDDDTVRVLNKNYRQKDAPTNVLSFAAMDDEDADAELAQDGVFLLGDVVIALQTVQREAADLRLPFEAHFSHLVVHGVLHLLGFDHIEDEDAEEMETLETQILKKLGFDNPYAAVCED